MQARGAPGMHPGIRPGLQVSLHQPAIRRRFPARAEPRPSGREATSHCGSDLP
jgi:hypothetical protein